ncbi:hypothetical protein SCD_n00121 [Sulfuricella denitrificans skB26]|uniref:SinR family protein n=1 Tax=Sulfuricella denitrificans (strain DSM 22764 / NBRC 105220 / skB26) TaxID=1163617 RepID=S6A9E5_SULDS|nr:hypothetical protein [Sulfuricella denitrificans]BAN33970.1 hypothetical protein SCD_n00121 [Sulfuricella denitrificans skB26]
MATYLITYDLNRPGQNYNDLFEAIKKIGIWWHCLDSTWIVKSNLTAAQVRDSLTPAIDNNDSLLVVVLSGVGAWTGLDDDCSSWLKNNL